MFGWLKNNKHGIWSYDDIATPLTEADYLKISEDAINARLDWIDSTEWKLIQDEDDILIEELDIAGSDVTCIKAVTLLRDIDIAKMHKEMFNPTYEQRKKIYEELTSHEVVKKINDDMVVAHSKYKAPFGVTDRDFLALRIHKILEDGSFLSVVHSINLQSVPFENGYIRGISNCAVLLIPMPEYYGPNIVKCITIDHIEPKGWVPGFVINQYKKKAGERLEKMRKIYECK